MTQGTTKKECEVSPGMRLQSGSALEDMDLDKNGIISDDEINRTERSLAIENEDKRQDAQRKMAWFALFGMLLYPTCVMLSDYLGLDNASQILGNMAPTYFVSVAAIVAAFYGAQAYATGRSAVNVTQDYQRYQ